jgi:hypothetical protein
MSQVLISFPEEGVKKSPSRRNITEASVKTLASVWMFSPDAAKTPEVINVSKNTVIKHTVLGCFVIRLPFPAVYCTYELHWPYQGNSLLADISIYAAHKYSHTF